MQKVTEKQLGRMIELEQWELEYRNMETGLAQVFVVKTRKVMTIRCPKGGGW